MLRVAWIALALIGALLADSARAETVTGWNADTRVVVSLQVKPEAAQQWLTGPWQVNPVPSGPGKGANAVLVFVDQHLTVDPDGKPAGSGINRLLALVFPGKHSGTGETASVVARIFSADPAYAPSPYKNAVPGQIRRERIVRESNTEPASGREMWTVRDSAGGVVELAFDYTGGLPARSRSESKVYSAVEPTFFRIYLPLAKPVVATAVILQFMHSWNDFLLPLVLTLSRPELRTLSVGICSFRGEHLTDWSAMAAASTIALLPIILLFLLLQRYFVESVAGAMKG